MNPNEVMALVNKSVRNINTYHLDPLPAKIKLDQNENPNDWPLEIKNEIAEFCRKRPWNRYPAFVPENLKKLLAEYTGHTSDGILAGNGSNEMLLVLLLSFANAKAGVVLCQPTFTVYNLLASGLGAGVSPVMLNADMSFNVDSICAEVKRRPGSVLVICSPNNPTGSCLDEAQIRTVLKAHTGILVLDQAYVEFGGYNGVPLLKEYPNLIITRTFSKAMAGAGLRLGYMLGRPEIIKEINKIKLPYNINFFSEHVAEILLMNRELVISQIELITKGREELYSFFRTLPFDNVYPSGANFLLVRLKRKKELFDHLLGCGILVRDVSGYPMLENCLRINVGTSGENSELKRAMEGFFSAR
ncbi:MAG TPA: histidinol-phosphate transaminase [Fibrobacteres bacterium]|jgi:histidinol-phosphate aminotransferase|nr:histidinol-phosphate transaminase [Fibrobacterota bacterium]